MSSLPAQPPTPPSRVLIVDDNESNRVLAQQTLEDNQKRAEDAVRQKREEASRQVADEQTKLSEQWQKESAAKKAAVPAVSAEAPQRVAIDLNVSASQQPGAVPAQLSPTDVQKIANEVVRQIGIARTTSNR